MFDEDKVPDYVGPIVVKMNEGKYDAARHLLNQVPAEWKEAVRWTIAAQTAILL